MERDLLGFLGTEIAFRKQPDRSLKVAIDGRCASGKSRLAARLAPVLEQAGCKVVSRSVDDFHHPTAHRYQQGEFSASGYYEDAFDYQAVRNCLGEVEPAAVLLFDGLFLFRRELNAYWDFRILLEIDAATSLSRALERDTDVIGPPEVVRRKYAERYEPAWQLYVDAERPETKADVIVDNRDFDRPRLLKHTML